MVKKKNCLVLILFLLFFLLGGCAQVIQDAQNLVAQEEIFPNGAVIKIVKNISEKVVQIAVEGVQVIKVEILEHKNLTGIPIIIANRNSFILEKGQSFCIWFRADGKSSPKKIALTGEEYIWGDVLFLGEGLVALPTKRGPSIFAKKHLPSGVQKKVDKKEIIAPFI